ncbi:MAG TPA: cytochrome c3 family protein [Candidatus Acidoferrales bacterium]|nr:cytochrome c3 family protein [Candidatus Acidoferrales bacterium]
MRVALRWGFAVVGVSVLAGLAWKAVGTGWPAGSPPASSAGPSAWFTPAHRGFREAFADFRGWRPIPVQPIAFTHRLHLERQIRCRSCHAGVDQGPVAGIPSVKICMLCHTTIATDRPEIKKVAAYAERGEEIPWQRVYAFTPEKHVKFNHAPHMRAGVDCAKCHGEMSKQTVAQRTINLTMGYCLDCHKAKNASTECIACHY